jgi:hypothetical protein
MAYVTPGTVAAGDVATAAAWNVLVANDVDGRSYQNRFATARRTTGNVTLNSTSWANVDTALDLTLGGSAGDVIEATLSALWNADAVQACLDVVTVVSAAPVNSFATGTTVTASTLQGVGAWIGNSGIQADLSGSFFYTLVAGDISGGNVLLRLRYRTTTAANKTLIATTDVPFVFFARNHGPVTTA